MVRTSSRLIFHIIGVLIVTLWFFLLSYLYRDIHREHEERATNIKSIENSWFEIFFKDKKIGYFIGSIAPINDGYIVKENLFIKVAFMGYPEEVSISARCRTDKDFLLRDFDLAFIAEKIRFHISGIVKGKELVINRRIGGKKVQYKIYLLRPPVLGISMFPFIRAKSLSVGDILSFSFLDPTTMTQREIKIKVVSKEKIKIKKMHYNALRLETEIWGNPVIIWVDRDGNVLKEEGLMGLTIVRSNPHDAMAHLVSPDLYNIASVKVSKSIPDPRKISYLKIMINGGDFNNKIMEIKKTKLPSTPPYSIPYQEKDMSPYLSPEFNIESNNTLIINKAKEIAGKEKDPIKVTRKIVHWVYKNIKKRPVISFPSALETLRSKIGDCNEHAVLITALLRSIGIPARICVGLVYNNGRFFYHAWNEAYLGEWIPLDATLDQIPVDATHIRLFYGNIEKHVQITRMIGNLKIKILDFSHDKTG